MSFIPTFDLVLLACLSLLSTAIWADAAKNAAPMPGSKNAKSPKYAVVGYITAYQYNDFSAIRHFDAGITTAIEEQLNVSPENIRRKSSDAEKRQIEIICRNEHEKRTSGAYAPFETQGRSTGALSPLYKVLYPGMKYRLLAVRDVASNAPDAAKRHCVKEVTLELIYPDIGCAPYHKGRRIKRGGIKVRLRKWNWPLQYKVCGYIPMREGMKFTCKSRPAKRGVLNRSTPEEIQQTGVTPLFFHAEASPSILLPSLPTQLPLAFQAM